MEPDRLLGALWKQKTEGFRNEKNKKHKHVAAVGDKERKNRRRWLGGLQGWGPGSVGQEGSKVCQVEQIRCASAFWQ